MPFPVRFATLGRSLAFFAFAATSVFAAAPALPPGVQVVPDLTYARHATGPLALDLYRPARLPAAPLPLVVWVHGGGWKSGSKQNCPLKWLAAEGYAVASLDVRLLPVAGWPAQLEDPRAAIRWLREHAAAYGLDPLRVVIAGGSSGGHVAALVGTTSAPAGEKISSRVQGVIDLYGPSDLLTMPPNLPGPGKTDADLARSNGALLLGGIVRDRPDLARAASALYHVSLDDPPFLILHGDADPQVPLDQSRRLHARLQESGVSSELFVLPSVGHGGTAFDTPEIRGLIFAFLARTLPR